MIRHYRNTDCEKILTIWLSASVKAHDFIEAEFWQSQLDNMREQYLPMSETYVFEKDGEIYGFYSLYENHLAAIFVHPTKQNSGIGKQLLTHAKQQRTHLTLSVYVQNNASYQFYLAQGFTVVSKQADIHTGKMEFTMQYSIMNE